MFLLSVVFFALGATVASFVGVLAARINTGQGFLAGRSRCDACDKPLPPFALVPVISYFIFNGRAHCCGARLSAHAPLTEILLGVLFTLSYLRIGLTCALFFMLISLSLLLALVLYDLAHQILPTILLSIFVLSGAATGFLLAQHQNSFGAGLAPSLSEFSNILIVALLIASFLALIHFFSRGRAMGLADAPFVFGLSMLVSSSAFTGFVLSFWIGAIAGIAILAGRPRGHRMGIEVPFAPFLAAGFLLAFFTQWNPFAFLAALH